MNNNIIENENETERQTSRFDYKVEQVPFHLPNGTATRFLANVRVDNNEVLGVVSERYEVLQNEDFFNPVEDLFKTEGFGNYTRKTVCTHGGARVRAVYDFKDHGIKIPVAQQEVRVLEPDARALHPPHLSGPGDADPRR